MQAPGSFQVRGLFVFNTIEPFSFTLQQRVRLYHDKTKSLDVCEKTIRA